MVVCWVPSNGKEEVPIQAEEVPIQAEGALVVAREVGECQRVTFQDPMVVAVEEATLFFLEALGMVLRVWVDIDGVS